MKNARIEHIEFSFAPLDVHDAERQTGRAGATFAVAMLTLVAEALLGYQVSTGQMPLAHAWPIHAALALLLFAYARIAAAAGDQRFALLLLITTAVAGPFGAGGTILAMISYGISFRNRMSFQEWFASLFPRLTIGPSQALFEAIRSGRDESAKSYSVVPFLDIMSFGSELQKRQALAKMAAHFYPGFAPAFKKGLSDGSNMIRVQAATAIAKVESEFQMRAITLSALKKKYTDEPRLLWALAELYDDYSHTGLIDPDRERQNRQLSLEHYQAYLHLNPEDERAYVRIGRLLMRAGENEKACEWLRRCIEKHPVSEAMADWYSEALFRCGRYDELRRWCAGLTPGEQRATLQPALAEALDMWKQGAVNPAGGASGGTGYGYEEKTSPAQSLRDSQGLERGGGDGR